MSLPKLDSMMIELVVPSTKIKLKMKKMRVKEEKILLTAKEGKDIAEILLAIKQCVNNCVVTPNFDIDQLALFDLEYLFLKLRAVSVDSIARVSYQDGDEKYDFDIDLNTIEVKFPENITNVIKVNESITLELGYPSAALYSDTTLLSLKPDQFFNILLSKCIKKIYQGDKQFNLDSHTPEEIEEFVDSLDIPVYEKIKEYFSNLPRMEHIIEYKNKSGVDRKITLSTLDDFFILA